MKRCVFAGSSVRALNMFALPLKREFEADYELAAVFDVNRSRAEEFARRSGIPAVYTDFDRMLEQEKPDMVIVATVDCTHHTYIIKALEAGVDVVSEKPMTISAPLAKQILDAQRRSGKNVAVTFNMRFMPYMAKVKQLLQEGVLGEVRQVTLEWFLDRVHGADYFRRWHRYRKNSGGLLVHKATHHFDVVNWWLEQQPEKVFAWNSLKVYGKNGPFRAASCRTCTHTAECPFYFDLRQNELYVALYEKAQQEDGYLRDGCVFAEDIDIDDTMSVQVSYKEGAVLNYSLTAYNAYEGWKAVLIGDKGRIEAGETLAGLGAEKEKTIRFYPNAGEMTEYHLKADQTVHGGGDIRLRKFLFGGGGEDPLGQAANSRDGYYALAVGDAANRSAKSGDPEEIEEVEWT